MIGISLGLTTVNTIPRSPTVLPMLTFTLRNSPSYVYRYVPRTLRRILETECEVFILSVDEFHAAYPEAKMIGTQGLVAKKAGKFQFDGGQ